MCVFLCIGMIDWCSISWHTTTCFSQMLTTTRGQEAGRGSNDLLMRLGNVCYRRVPVTCLSSETPWNCTYQVSKQLKMWNWKLHNGVTREMTFTFEITFFIGMEKLKIPIQNGLNGFRILKWVENAFFVSRAKMILLSFTLLQDYYQGFAGLLYLFDLTRATSLEFWRGRPYH